MALIRNVITSPNEDYLDAFSNVPTAPPAFVADGQFTYDLQPLVYEQITSGDGTVTHNATERAARCLINTATGAGNKAIMQSFQYYRYQSGRAQQIFITFNFNSNTGVSNLRRFASYGDENNAIGFELNGTTKNFFIKSDTSVGDQSVAQSAWNLDKLDGTGKSGYTLDTSKTLILVIDFQALYVGRVRIGFDIDGVIIWCHQFLHSNRVTAPYIQTANLPVRVGMESSGTTATDDDMLFICSCVLSRGGQGKIAGFDFSVSGTVTAGSGTRTHLLSVRPKTTFNSITNRVEFVLEDIEIVVTGSNSVYWELCLGQALTAPTYTDANTTYSAFEYVAAGVLSGSPAIVTASGFCAGSSQTKGQAGRDVSNRYPIALDAAGAVRSLGTLTLLVTGIGGTSDCRAELHWRELR
jgi:hypothetical protein